MKSIRADLWLMPACLLGIALGGVAAGSDLQPILKSHWPGSLTKVAVSGDHAYVALKEGGLRVIDVSDPAQPAEAGGYPASGSISEIVVVGDRLFLGEGQRQSADDPGPGDGLVVLDISDPSVPTFLGNYSPGAGVAISTLAIAGTHAYAVISKQYDGAGWVSGGDFVILDVSDPTRPTRVGGFNPGNVGGSLAVSGGQAYLDDLIIDVSDPTNPHVVEGAEGMRQVDIAVSGNRAYVAKSIGAWVYDLSNPTAPALLGQAGDPGYDTISIAAQGDMAFLAKYSSSSLAILDVSDPKSPRRIGGYFGFIRDVAVSGDHVFLADRDNGLVILDVSRPATPPQAGRLRLHEPEGGGTPGVLAGTKAVFDIASNGSTAYVAAGTSGLHVVDVSNPTRPVRLGGYETAGKAVGVAVEGDRIYLTSQGEGGDGLLILDVANPTEPRFLGSHGTAGDADDVVVRGHLVFLTDANRYSGSQKIAGEGLVVVDVSDPANPRRVGSLEMSLSRADGPSSLAVVGDHAYVAACSALRVVDISDPAAPVEVDSFEPGGCVMGVAVSERHALVADWQEGLHLLDLADPAHPVRIAGYGLRGWWFGMVIEGSTGYVSNGSGIWLLDLANPDDLRAMGGYSAEWVSTCVNLAGSKVLVGAGDEGLVVMETRPFFRSIMAENGNLHLSWEGAPGTQIESTTNFADPVWETVDGASEAGSCVLPAALTGRFFRLVEP